MSISIRQAFKNVASEKYDKIGILVNTALYFAFAVCCIYIPQKGIQTPNISQNLFQTIFASILCFIFSCIIIGFYYLTINNGLKNKHGTFPDIITDFSNIIYTGFKGVSGQFVLSLLLVIPSILVSSVFGLLIGFGVAKNIQPVPVVVIFVIFLSAYFLFVFSIILGTMLNYVQNLKFSSWFEWGKAFKFLKRTGKRCGVWILKSIILSIILMLVLVIISIILSLMFGISSAFTGGFGSAGGITGNIQVIMNIIVTTIFGALSVFYMDLIVQFLSEFKQIPQK